LYEALQNEWKWLVELQPEGHEEGSPTVRVFWKIVEHRMTCEVCRDEAATRELEALLK
jgi:hypothetical protein